MFEFRLNPKMILQKTVSKLQNKEEIQVDILFITFL